MENIDYCGRRYPLTNASVLCSFEKDADGFEKYSNIESLEWSDKLKRIICRCANVPADEWHIIRKDFEKPQDLSESSDISLFFNCDRFAPGNEYFFRLKIIGLEQNDICQWEKSLYPDTNHTLIFNMSNCAFRNSISAIEIAFRNNGKEKWQGHFNIGNISVGNVVDWTFTVGEAAKHFTSSNAEIQTTADNALEFRYGKGSVLESPTIFDAQQTNHNMLMQIRNTMFFVMENAGSADKVRISFITKEDPVYDDKKTKIFDIEPYSAKKAYFFNFSDVSAAQGHLAGFRLEPLNAGENGVITISRITFEEEEAIIDFAGAIASCRAQDGIVTVKGALNQRPEGFNKVEVYEIAMHKPYDEIKGLKLLGACQVGAAKGTDSVGDFVVMFPFNKGNMTHLSSQFLAVLVNDNGEYKRIAPRFYIDNWEDYSCNPYSFVLPDYEVSVVDFGATGDAFTDDTDAIQRAIDNVSQHGGGRVNIPVYNTGRFVITHIELKSNVELHISQGAILWQSQKLSDYKYDAAYGHDIPLGDINWTHALHVANYPLIQAKFARNIKITGKGSIRSMDVGSEDNSMCNIGRWPINCADRIHCITIGFYCVENVEFRDFSVVRVNNYHMSLYASRNIYIANLRMYEAKCVSGDGIGFNCGSNRIKIERCFFNSNDDGVVITASYNDPRGKVWWWGCPGGHNGLHDIEVCHSYFNSGGGKAIAFITWGTDDPCLENEEIENIVVTDCVLKGGYSVGTWPDNPYNGKMPFDNSETDDYSPVKNVRILNNEYLSQASLLCIKPTNFISDCGIHSASEFQNDSFEHGVCYWSCEGDVVVTKGQARASAGRIYQGLYLEAGTYRASARVDKKGILFVEHTLTGKLITEQSFVLTDFACKTVEFTITNADTYSIGIYGGVTEGMKLEKLS